MTVPLGPRLGGRASGDRKDNSCPPGGLQLGGGRLTHCLRGRTCSKYGHTLGRGNKQMGFQAAPLIRVPVTGDSPERPVTRGTQGRGLCAQTRERIIERGILSVLSDVGKAARSGSSKQNRTDNAISRIYNGCEDTHVRTRVHVYTHI